MVVCNLRNSLCSRRANPSCAPSTTQGLGMSGKLGRRRGHLRRHYQLTCPQRSFASPYRSLDRLRLKITTLWLEPYVPQRALPSVSDVARLRLAPFRWRSRRNWWKVPSPVMATDTKCPIREIEWRARTKIKRCTL